MSNVADVKKVLPNTPQTVEELAKELDKTQDIRRVITSKGGKFLMDSLIGNAKASLNHLLQVYPTATRDELVGIISDFAAAIRLHADIQGAAGAEDDLQDRLDEAVLEAVRDQEDR